jgi:triosephosphate isomerase
LARRVVERAGEFTRLELLVCPPAVYLDSVNEVVAGTAVALGAQNVYHEPDGAFTGEISTAMLRDVGCRFVIVGHSERRHILGETDDVVNKKTIAALAAGLTPIVCVGELLAERDAGQTAAVIRRQFEGSLANVPAGEIERLVIAYEPVWAIGTGKVATPTQAEEVHADLRRLLAERYNNRSAEIVRILYGGSVKPSNACELLSQPNIDGALVGGASLKVDDFLGIAAAAP